MKFMEEMQLKARQRSCLGIGPGPIVLACALHSNWLNYSETLLMMDFAEKNEQNQWQMLFYFPAS